MSKEQERAERVRRFLTHLDLAERAAHFGYWRFDLRDGAYFWSPGMYRLLEEDPAKQKPDMEYLYSKMLAGDRDVVESAIRTAIKTRSSFSYRTYARDTKNNTRIIDTQGEVELDEDGRVAVLLGVCHDLTAQVRAEEERERAEAMYRLMTEETGDIIILYSPDAKVVFVSQALERLTGRTVEEIRDGGYKNLVHPDDTQEAAKMTSRPQDGDTVVATWRIQHRDGHYIWLETTIRTIYDGGVPKNVISVSRDVTARVEAEEARRKADEMYRVMTTEASDVIVLYGAERQVLFASDALERVIGRSIADVEQGNWLQFVHPDDLPFLLELELPPRQREELTWVYRYLHRDGRYVWLEVKTRARYAPDGAYLGYISVARDVTERKQREIEAKAAQDRAETANRAKSQFLANMSHELRTPLNAIIGFSDLMKVQAFGPLGDPRYENYAMLIYDSGQLLLDLITDMLDMAKIEAGKLELNFERVDLSETICDVVRLLGDRAHSAGVRVKVEGETKLSLLADRRAVKQVVINLLTNAIKFTPRGGEVTVRAARDGGSARVTIADTGIGIPESALPRLGKPFEQVCDDPNLAKTGTGLGLALVKALTEKHSGGMAITSREGEGTEVTVTFALDPAAHAAA